MRTLSEALHAHISGDVTLSGYCPGGLWLDVAPPPAQATRPVLVYSLQGASLDEAMCAQVVRRFRYLVTVEGTQDQAVTIRSAAARLDDLLHRAPWAATGWTILRAVFVDVVERAWVDGDARLLTVTGSLEIVAEQD